MEKDAILGTKVFIVGVIEEHLTLASKSQEWVSIRLENDIVITINRKYCKPIMKDEDDNTDNKSSE